MDSCSSRITEGLLLAVATLCVTATAALAPQCAQAQHAQYKWTDSAGRVHYSDRPPPVEPHRVISTQATAQSANAAGSVGDASLPWALRSAATRYPVVLYTALECDPCEIARTHLKRRGVPYTEKRIENAADLQAFEALGFGSSLFPSASIGREKLTGFEAGNWNRVLDATGYPKSSMLPITHVVRTLEPMRPEPARTQADAQGDAAGASAAGEATAAAKVTVDAKSVLATPSFRTGPNPIRF